MPQQRTLKAVLDDALLALQIKDFAGGLNSEADPQDLAPNESPDCQNVKFTKDGKVIGRAGYVVRVGSVPSQPDGIAFFYDSLGRRTIALWANGNLYDCSGYSLALVAGAVYTAGNKIAWTTLNDILYYSDGAIPLRQWNPGLATEAAVATGAGIAPPAAKVLATVDGCIVAGATTVSGTYEPHSLRWSNVADPTNWSGTAAQKLGEGQGGEINSILPLSVSSSGVSPYKAVFVGKSQKGIFVMKGALGSLEEVLVNAPTGVLNGSTVRYVPGPDGSGYVMWLGADNRVWFTNGVYSGEVSSRVRSEIQDCIFNRLAANPKAVFSASVNYQDFQYVLDLGMGTQYCYDYDRKIWTRYQGWPSGYWCEGKDGNGQHILYCADRINNTLSQVNLGVTDNGTAIAPHYKTGYLHAADPEQLKVWKFMYVAFVTDTGDIDYEVTPNRGTGTPATGTISAEAIAATGALWDVAIWNTDVWDTSVVAGYNNYKKKSRLKVPTTGLDGSVESLRGGDIQVKLALGEDTPAGHFEIDSVTLLFLPRGRKRIAA